MIYSMLFQESMLVRCLTRVKEIRISMNLLTCHITLIPINLIIKTTIRIIEEEEELQWGMKIQDILEKI